MNKYLKKILDKEVANLALNKRARIALEEVGIKTIYDFFKYNHVDLCRLPNVGGNTLDHIWRVISDEIIK